MQNNKKVAVLFLLCPCQAQQIQLSVFLPVIYQLSQFTSISLFQGHFLIYWRIFLSGCGIWAQTHHSYMRKNNNFFSEMANLTTALEALFGELNRRKWQTEKGC